MKSSKKLILQSMLSFFFLAPQSQSAEDENNNLYYKHMALPKLIAQIPTDSLARNEFYRRAEGGCILSDQYPQNLEVLFPHYLENWRELSLIEKRIVLFGTKNSGTNNLPKEFYDDIQKQAGSGECARSQFFLGWMYDYGIYVEKDEKKAIQYCQNAADQGDIIAQAFLGWYYSNLPSIRDDKKAIHFYQLAAQQGFALAQANLGHLYEKGEGIPQDNKQAVYWYQKSANQECSFGQGKLGWMYENGRGVNKNVKQALYWYKRAVKHGELSPQNNIGSIYKNGQGIVQNYTKAIHWFQKAADRGDMVAQFNLGVMYENGQGVPQDYKQAAAWYKKGADQGGISAKNNLGVLYENGRGIRQSHIIAVELYLEAANAGNTTAQHNLGMMYENGRGVDKNVQRAMEWYTEAARQGNKNALSKIDSLAPYFGLKILIESIFNGHDIYKELLLDILTDYSKMDINPLDVSFYTVCFEQGKLFSEFGDRRDCEDLFKGVSELKDKLSFLDMSSLRDAGLKMGIFWTNVGLFLQSLEQPGSLISCFKFEAPIDVIYTLCNDEEIIYKTEKRIYFSLFPKQIIFMEKLPERIQEVKEAYSSFTTELSTIRSTIKMVLKLFSNQNLPGVNSLMPAFDEFFKPYEDQIAEALKILPHLQQRVHDYIDNGAFVRNKQFETAIRGE